MGGGGWETGRVWILTRVLLFQPSGPDHLDLRDHDWSLGTAVPPALGGDVLS